MSETKNITKYVIPLFALLCLIFLVALFQSRFHKSSNNSDLIELKFEAENMPELDFVHYALWGVTESGEKIILKRFVVYDDIPYGLDNQKIESLKLDKDNVYKSYEVSIEKLGDRDEIQSECVLLQGKVDNNIANLTSTIDLSNISGSFTIATITDKTTETNEKSGIWFTNDINNPNSSPSLNLPRLDVCWTWSAFLLYRGQYLRIGSFTSTNSKDDFSDYSYFTDTPINIPGEDFFRNLGETIEPPINVTHSGNSLIVDIEPKQTVMQLSNEYKPLVKVLEYNFDGNEKERVPVEMVKNDLPSLKIEIGESE